MRDFNEIIANGKLQILTKLNDENGVQIRAYFTHPITQKRYWCKFTSAMGWEHLSISPQPQRGKVPEWDVMCRVKDIFWSEEECCVEYHPRESQYVNNNETCLHIWKPINETIPEPPTILLGFTNLNAEQSDILIQTYIDSLPPAEQMQLAEKIGIKVNRKMRRG